MSQLWSVWIPAVTTVVSLVFAAMVLGRWAQKRHAHDLLWGIGLVMYAVGTGMEFLYGIIGWREWIFRLWYLFGAVLVAAWLGMGTAYLLVRGGRRRIAHTLLAILIVGSLYAAYKVLTAELNPANMLAGELSGQAIVSSGVRTLTPFFNSFGVLLLAGGALYSAWLFYRKRILLNRMLGNLFIAAGALAPAMGGLLQRANVPVALYLSELVGAVLLFVGFLLATRPAPTEASRRAPAPAQHPTPRG
jgi:hypothetical protein